MGLKLITAPASTPVTLAELKAHCRIEDTDSDTELQIYLDAATEHLDGYTGTLGRCIVTQTWELVLDKFPSSAILLELGPLQSVTSVKYYDTDGVEQTVDSANYTVDTASLHGWVVPDAGFSWPSTLDAVNVVKVRYVAGYTSVPNPLKHAILLLAGHWFAHREVMGGEAEMPFAVNALIASYRVYFP